MLKPTPDPDHPPDPDLDPDAAPDPRPPRPGPRPASDLVPRYRRCGGCNRCHGGTGTRPRPGDCWSDYLDAVTAALTVQRGEGR